MTVTSYKCTEVEVMKCVEKKKILIWMNTLINIKNIKTLSDSMYKTEYYHMKICRNRISSEFLFEGLRHIAKLEYRYNNINF